MPKITVIVPVYKVEPYLRRCVDSILNQTFTDFELILVDDGSPDGCGVICDEYIDPRITVIHQPNGGLSAARNSGIDWAFACSDSEWLAFVDSDDWVHPQYLEYLYRAVCETDAKLSVCEFEESSAQTEFEKIEYGTQIQTWDSFLPHNVTAAVVAWNKLYAKDLFDGLRYPVGKIHEDEYLTYKLMHRAGRLAHVVAPLYYYFWNPDGITKSPFTLAEFDGAEALRERIDYVRANGYKELAGWCAGQFLSNVWSNLHRMREAESITDDSKQRIEKKLKEECQKVLLRYGLKYAPPWTECHLYDFAFPHVNNFVRHSVRLYRKVKGLVK